MQELLEKHFELSQNDTGEWDKIATYEVGEGEVLTPLMNRVMNLYFVTKYTETGVDVSGSSATVTVDENVPDVPDLPVNGGVAVAYAVDSGSGDYEQAPVSSYNTYKADSNPNQLTLDTSDLSGTGQDVKVYHIFVPGQFQIGASAPRGQSIVEGPLHGHNLYRLHEVSQDEEGRTLTLSSTTDLPEGWEFWIKLNSSVQVSWEEDGFNSFIEIPVKLRPLSSFDVPKSTLENRAEKRLSKSKR